MKRFFVFVFSIVLLAFEGFASEKITLSDIEMYLNAFDNVTGEFEQWDVNGAYKQGQLYVQKPGKIRLQYNPPSKFVIIGDGQTLFFSDQSSGDISYMPIKDSPASFLLDQSVDLRTDYKIKEFSFDDDIITLILAKKNHEDIGSLQLTFGRKPHLYLRQWTVIDAHGKTTLVRLSSLKKTTQIDSSLFKAPM